jgi:K319-like protein
MMRCGRGSRPLIREGEEGMGRRACALLVVAAAVVLGLATQDAARATIDAVSGQIELLPTAPPSVLFDALQSDSTMFAFAERQQVVLSAPLAVDFTQPGTYALGTDLQPATIPAGTVVNSQFVSSNEATKPCGTCARQFEGTIHTDSPILGVILLSQTLDASDYLGAPDTHYPTGLPGRKLELNVNQEDTVIEEIDRHTLVIHSEIRLQAADQVRIVTQGNRAPVVSAGEPVAGVEGSAVALAGSVVDPDGDTATAAWSYVAGAGVDADATCSFAAAGSPSTSITCTDDGTYVATLTADDGANSPVSSAVTVTVSNAAPSVAMTSTPSFAQQGSTASVSASFGDAGTNDSHSCSIAWGDSSVTTGSVSEMNGSGTCTGMHAYSGTGGQTIVVTVTDDDGASDSATLSTLVYATCPVKGKVNVRWHYSVGGPGGWSGVASSDCADGSVRSDRQAMEGDLRLTPGTLVKAGYDLSLPGNKLPSTAVVLSPTVTFTVRCASGSTPSASTFAIALGTQSYDASGPGWFPSAEQKSPLVYQGSAAVPDLCGGGTVRLDRGGTFTAVVGLY